MGYTLLIAEKPDAMRKIAESLAEDRTLKRIATDQGVDRYEFIRNNKKHLIVAAVGHLFNLSPTGRGEWVYPIFDAEWRPSFEVRKQSLFSKRYFEAIKDVAKDASDFIICCDYDIEGSTIGSNILRFLCKAKDAKRMKFSVDWDEDLIILNDNNAYFTKIGEFVDNYLQLTKKQIDGEIEYADISHLNIKTFSFNPKALKTSFKKITKVIRHKTHEKLSEIKLESGRRIKVTKGHSLFVLRDGEIKTVSTNEIKIGDYVVCPLSINHANNLVELNIMDKLNKVKGRKWKLPDKIPITKEFIRLIGYYLSEGSCGERHVSLDFGRHEKNLADDACYCIENVFGIKPKINEKKSSLNISFGGKIGVVLFDEILNLGRNSKNKKIPDFVFNVSPELKLEVIKGIFEGDATVSGYSLVLNTASLVLASQLLYLFLTLGIYADFLAYTYNHKNLFGKLVRQKVYRVFIQNNEELKKLEFLFPEWKQKWSAYRKERRKFEYRNNVKEYHTAIPIAKSLLPKFSNRREKIGRISLLRLIDKIELDEGRRSFIKQMINSNLVFLKVREINEVEPSNGHVYDLSVEENENFICGIGGIFAHNSTLTKEELIDSYKNMSNHLDFGQIEAGLTRHWLDWLWGLNLTRALTLAMKNQSEKGFKILSTGRVQGPTLALLLERELEIRRFVSKPYWHLELHCRVDSNEIVAMHEKGQFWDRDEADRILRLCKGKDAIVKDIAKRQYRQMPPYPFNTTDLQSEAYSHFKFSPSQTLDLAESLYQMGAISYPRTSSQKLPIGIGYGKILKALSSIEHYNDLCNDLLKRSKLIPHEGPKEDPAHPAIYPTSEVPDLRKLTAQQRKVYDLVVRRFMATFADPAIRESTNLTLVIEDNNFVAIGRRNISLGWARFYSPYITFEEQILPEVRIGQRLENLKIDMIEKWTEPPDRYSQGSIIKEMEKRNLGTRATRAEILQTLYGRNYISGKSIKVTKLGETVTNVLKDFCPRIISEELTRNFEEEMELIMQEKKKRDEVVEEAIDFLMDIINEIKRNERRMGEELLKGLMEAREEERKLGVCQKCKGELRIIRSRKSGKVFVGCGSYPNCKNSYPLPQSAKITPLGRACEKCLTPIIQVNRKGRRAFTMCLDPKCPKKSNLSNNRTFKIQAVDNA